MSKDELEGRVRAIEATLLELPGSKLNPLLLPCIQ